MTTGFDLDAFLVARAPDWARLRQLVKTGPTHPGESDELVARYQQASADLARLRTVAPDPAVLRSLSVTVAAARAAVVGGSRRRGWAALGRGITVEFPLAVYQSWRWWCAVATANTVVAIVMMLYVSHHPDRLYRAIPSDDVKQLVNHDFADYYSASPAQSFAFQVWTNNALVAALSLILGVTLIGTIVVLWQNIANVGIIGGAMLGAGKADVFWGLILPHGLLELTAVFVAAGTGLRLGWAWVAPGTRSRGEAMASAGRSTIVIAIGLIGVLAVSGVIEAFVTPSGLPTWARITIGAFAEAAFLTYVVGLGRRAALAGASADLDRDEREDTVPSA